MKGDPLIRFWEKTAYVGDCILWTACTHPGGYGKFSVRHTMIYAHRWLYEQMQGPILRDLCLDHLCRNRCCVNLAHLRLVDVKTNTLAPGSLSRSRLNLIKTHCPRGHAYNYLAPSGGRRCRVCDYALRHKRQCQEVNADGH